MRYFYKLYFLLLHFYFFFSFKIKYISQEIQVSKHYSYLALILSGLLYMKGTESEIGEIVLFFSNATNVFPIFQTQPFSSLEKGKISYLFACTSFIVDNYRLNGPNA